MGHLIVGAGIGLAAFVLVLLQGAGIVAALGAYAAAGAAATLALALVPEALAAAEEDRAPPRRRPDPATL